MSWDQLARDSLQSAKNLQRSGNHVHRSVVSRAYYAVYCASTYYILSHLPKTTFGNNWNNPTHEQLKVLLKALDARLRPSSSTLSSITLLRELRVNADYRPAVTVSASIATNALMEASKVLKDLGL